MADRVADRIDLVVAKRRRLLGRAQFGCQREVGHRHALGVQHDLECPARAGTRVAHIHALAGQFLEGGHAAIGTGDDGEGLGMHAEDRAQFGEGVALVVRAAVIGVELPVRLGHAHRHVARLDGVDVGDRAAGRGRGAAQAVVGRFAVHKPADRLPHHVIDTRLAAGADGDELLLLGQDRPRCQCQRAAQKGGFHEAHSASPLVFCRLADARTFAQGTRRRCVIHACHPHGPVGTSRHP